ncbi:MAG: elongation factor Ts [Bacteroidetes bacterium]|uniref:Elongation factor Ts n=1 Tax=Candidatus Cryptobacteroides intestinigallinarum TaxID=2840767 RepID=A0A9D9HJJ2_9BACT|nr:elongation factor Ts [Candidatus Cryptobacteroides intestinigallinarum]
MEIKAADVMKLRQMTGAGMMDCKKALVEANGDYARAQEIIREKGKLVAAKRADRETTEGAVLAEVNGGKAILVSLGCETDFVSKNAEFQATAQAIADAAMAAFPEDAEALKACTLADGQTVEAAITQQTGKTGEKHTLAYYARLEAPYISSYIHKINGKLGAIVAFNKEVPAEVGKGIAMQVASMNPVAVNKESVSQEVIDKELTVAVEKTREELVKKAVNSALEKAGINPAHVDSEDHIESNTAKGWLTPEQADKAREIIKTVSAEKAANLAEAMVNNIANGRLNKFFKENTLEEQEYQMGDGKTSVKAFLASVDKDAKILAFKRFSLND